MSQAQDFVKITRGIPLHLAATLCINPTTAYRMLKDYVTLKKGMKIRKCYLYFNIIYRCDRIDCVFFLFFFVFFVYFVCLCVCVCVR